MNWKRVEWSRIILQGVMTSGATAVPFVLFDVSAGAKAIWAVVLAGLTSIILGLTNSRRRS